MYIGNDMLVESATNSTRIMEVATNFGSSVNNLRWGMKTPSDGALLFWGRMIHDWATLHNPRLVVVKAEKRNRETNKEREE